ncbi:hypothetical protein [Marinomonas communis]|uniref:hypothetical protein n=1 Tax=Marinomonas communis TaxID=28254 RepID=UPI001D18D240|nr:hypothetical protein [Marinomonas communis]MCC4275993.1 hypothetical protein [Marinomonas communis]
MWWIVGLAVAWLLWRLLTGGARREATLKDAIGRAFIASSKLGRDWIDTPIYWEAAERFALDRGVRIDREYSPCAHLNMTLNGEEIAVILMRNDLDGTTQVYARRIEDVASSFNFKDEVKDDKDIVRQSGWKAAVVRDICFVGNKRGFLNAEVSSSIEEVCEVFDISDSVFEAVMEDSSQVINVYPNEEDDERYFISSLVKVMLESEKVDDYYDMEGVEEKLKYIKEIANRMDVSEGLIEFSLYTWSYQKLGSFS